LSSDAEWKYVNVRRFFIYIEESIARGAQWVVFEPNDEPLWARLRDGRESRVGCDMPSPRTGFLL
jgi:phage tail sheath protein FI